MFDLKTYLPCFQFQMLLKWFVRLVSCICSALFQLVMIWGQWDCQRRPIELGMPMFSTFCQRFLQDFGEFQSLVVEIVSSLPLWGFCMCSCFIWRQTFAILGLLKLFLRKVNDNLNKVVEALLRCIGGHFHWLL